LENSGNRSVFKGEAAKRGKNSLKLPVSSCRLSVFIPRSSAISAFSAVKFFKGLAGGEKSGQVGGRLRAGQHHAEGPEVQNPEATAETLKGGWLHTGDLGKKDEEGYVYILDRKKDMIICSGYNVYPREVEELLHTHPAVMEAAVIGIPAPKRGESPMAFIIPRPGKKVTEEELIQFCKDNLANYQVIKAVKFVEEFPLNPNRKVLKRELREMLKK
jgi:long-chain acyl-CoA synthetase